MRSSTASAVKSASRRLLCVVVCFICVILGLTKCRDKMCSLNASGVKPASRWLLWAVAEAEPDLIYTVKSDIR